MKESLASKTESQVKSSVPSIFLRNWVIKVTPTDMSIRLLKTDTTPNRIFCKSYDLWVGNVVAETRSKMRKIINPEKLSGG
jgi:hypothetical protein